MSLNNPYFREFQPAGFKRGEKQMNQVNQKTATENDLQRLVRRGTETSQTNQKIVGSAKAILQVIFDSVPKDLRYKLPPGYGIEQHGSQNPWISLNLYELNEDGTRNHKKEPRRFSVECLDRLSEAEEFSKLVADGLVEKIAKAVSEYNQKQKKVLKDLQMGQRELEKGYNGITEAEIAKVIRSIETFRGQILEEKFVYLGTFQKVKIAVALWNGWQVKFQPSPSPVSKFAKMNILLAPSPVVKVQAVVSGSAGQDGYYSNVLNGIIQNEFLP